MERRTWGGFDEFLLDLTAPLGATQIQQRVSGNESRSDVMTVRTRKESQEHDRVVGATGVNSSARELYENVFKTESRPKLTRAYMTTAKLGKGKVSELFGTSLHIFLLDIERRDVAAIVPTGSYATITMLDDDNYSELLDRFFSAPQVRNVFPGINDQGERKYHCQPCTNAGAAASPYSDRFVMVGHSGVSRLNQAWH